MLADIYKADSDYTYQVGGYAGDEWTYEYSNKINDIFPIDTTDIDLSICIAGNNDCDHFKYVNMEYFPYRMVVKDSESSSPDYRKMVVDEKFTGYKSGTLLGSCLITTNNSSFLTWSITQRRMVVGSGDLSDGRFCLGNKVSGFKNLILAPSNLTVEKIPPVKVSTTRYAADSYENVTTLENIENRLLKSFSYDIKHFTRGSTLITSYTFANQYKPQLAFIVQCDDEILIVSAVGVFHNSNGGYLSNFQNGVSIAYTFGKMIDNPTWEQMCTDVTRPQWVCRPMLGNTQENLNSMYCETYVSRSTWYLYSTKLFIGALSRRIFTLSGLFFVWNNANIQSGVSVASFNDNLCLGHRDEYGLIKQDVYNKGWTDIQTNDEYFDKLDYNNLPTVNPNPPIPDSDDIQPVGYGYFSNTTMGTLYALKNKLDLEKITQWLLTQTEKIDIANNVISLKEIPFPLSTLGITPNDKNLKIGGVDVTYQGNNVVVGEIVAPAIPTISIVFADFDIPRLSGTFLDYAPYTKYELLVPFAPSPIALPDWCINKNVKAIFLYDIYTTACQYVIECNNERICSVSGNFGIDRPITAQNVALKDSARLSSQIATASSVLGGVMSGATGNIGGIISGAVGGVSALSQMILSGKQNYMYTVGANGDSSTVGLYHAAHLKITRTLSAEGENFVHVYGKPLCQVRKLSNVSGYTKCDNVNTSGLTCSESEKQMIKNLLESGVHI